MTSPIGPIYLINENGIDPVDNKAVIEGIETILKIAGVENKIKILDYSELIGKKYISPDGSSKEYKSLDYYLQQGKIVSRKATKLNATKIINLCAYEIAISGYKHYYVLILKSDIYLENTDFVIGAGKKGHCAIISTYRFKDLDDNRKYEVIKAEAMHEIGYVFGIPNNNRKTNVENNIGLHCTNECVMRQGLCIPDDWIEMTNNRLKSRKPLCDECIDDLKTYFGKK